MNNPATRHGKISVTCKNCGNVFNWNDQWPAGLKRCPLCGIVALETSVRSAAFQPILKKVPGGSSCRGGYATVQWPLFPIGKTPDSSDIFAGSVCGYPPRANRSGCGQSPAPAGC